MRHWLSRYILPSYWRLTRTGKFDVGPPVVLAAGFGLLILIGTLLLLLPFSTYNGISLITALFSAVSAVTITGMTTVDIGSIYTPVGQTILITLVQIGGLGFVTLSVTAALALGKRISLKQQVLAQEAFNQTNVSTVKQIAFAIIKITVVIEVIGILLFTFWWSRDTPLFQALRQGIFHSISAFNNAGMSISSTQIINYAGDPVIILGTTSLIILGGIGFSVLNDIWQKKSWRILTPYTRVIVLGTLALNVVGFCLIWLMERNNPATFGPLGFIDQALAAWLQTITTRTAGFNSVDITQLNDSTTVLMMLFMFIGGGSLSLASGIKVGTFIVLMASARAYIFQRHQVTLLNRAIPEDTIHKSLALLFVTGSLIFIATLLMTLLESAPFLNILFEVVSAISTTGLTRNLTPTLSTTSQCLVIVLMFVGRLGPLTLIYSLSTKRRGRIRYPEMPFQIG